MAQAHAVVKQEFAVEDTDVTLPNAAEVVIHIDEYESLQELLESADSHDVFAVEYMPGTYTLLYTHEIETNLQEIAGAV